MGFFDQAKVGTAVRFVNLAEVLGGGLERVLEAIVRHVKEINPAWVVVDSFRSVVRRQESGAGGPDLDVQAFVQRLGLYLTSWHATTFLVGEYVDQDLPSNPVFTVADGILWLAESQLQNSTVRQLRVVKMRGQARMPGLHTFRITSDGVHVFPRAIRLAPEAEGRSRPDVRLPTGIAGLDEMLGGGLPFGDVVMVAGPAGSGKTILADHFIAEGVRRGEAGLVMLFEEHAQDYIAQGRRLGFEFDAMRRAGKLELTDQRPVDLSVDELLVWIKDAAARIDAKRVVIDSLTGFEQALAAQWRGANLLESLYRLLGALTDLGLTALLIVEPNELYQSASVSPHGSAFLFDTILLQRFVELDGEMAQVMTVGKMRHGRHSKALRLYEITPRGIVMGETLKGWRGVLTGIPEPGGATKRNGKPRARRKAPTGRRP
jgi:circadian clock protein KaiC